MSNPNGKTVLVVEDEVPLRQALVDALTREGCNVLLAANGEQGLFAALKYHPDLILLDIIMPIMDGLTMLKKLRATDEWAAKVPVYLLTNSDINKSAGQPIVSDNTDYFLKSNWVLEDVIIRVKGRMGLRV